MPGAQTKPFLFPTPPTASLLPLCNQLQNKPRLFLRTATPSAVNRAARRLLAAELSAVSLGWWMCFPTPGTSSTPLLLNSSCVSPHAPQSPGRDGRASVYQNHQVFHHTGFPPGGFGPLSSSSPEVIQLIKHPFVLSLALNNWFLSIFELEGI